MPHILRGYGLLCAICRRFGVHFGASDQIWLKIFNDFEEDS